MLELIYMKHQEAINVGDQSVSISAQQLLTEGRVKTLTEGEEAIRIVEKLKSTGFMYRHFFDGLLSGQFEPISESEINRIIDQHHFGSEPMIPLSDDQEALLRSHLFAELEDELNREEMGLFCGDVYEDLDERPFGHHNVFLLDQEAQSGARHNKRKLTLLDKLNILEPERWMSQPYRIRNWTANFGLQGNRHLGESDYRSLDKDFSGLFVQIRKSTGKNKLTILDVGCGIGFALKGIKEVDSNVETHGLTIEQEPVMCEEADQYHYGLAERMPADFKEKFDIINSNYALRYCLFSDLALKNILLALSVGGYASLGFSFDRIPEDESMVAYFEKIEGESESFSAMQKIVARLWEKIKALEKGGKLEIVRGLSEKDHYHGLLQIKKLASLEPSDFE